MFSNSTFNQIAFGWAFVPTLVVAFLTFLVTRKTRRTVISATVCYWLTVFVMRSVLYWGRPAFYGAYDGYYSMVFLSTIAAFFGMLISFIGNSSDDDNEWGERLAKAYVSKKRLGLIVSAISFAVLIYPALLQFHYGYGLDQARKFAALGNIRVASDDEKMPPTDPNMILPVTLDMAYAKGQSIIGGVKGNLGSIYQTNKEDYTEQLVGGNAYWIAPLVYKDWSAQTGWFGTKFADSPGLIVVDAKHPNAQPEVRLQDAFGNPYHIRYMPDALGQQNLSRHIYEAGFRNGDLDDSTLEVDENWRPFYTTAYLKPAFVVTGILVDSILLTDAQTGDIKQFQPKDKPAWIDRVVSAKVASEYASDWGSYSDPRRTCYIGCSNQFQSKAVDIELHYNSQLQSVWVLPFTSKNDSDNSSTGILVYDTNKVSGVFYPGLRGLAVGDKIKSLFEGTSLNVTHFGVASLQVYSIDNVPTWVAIYSQSDSFSAIGMLDMRLPNGDNVVFTTDMGNILNSYAAKLATEDQSGLGKVSRVAQPRVEVTGKILAFQPQVENGNTRYYFILANNSHIFTVNQHTFAYAPFLREGHDVDLLYFDTNEKQEAVTSITDKTLLANLPAASK